MFLQLLMGMLIQMLVLEIPLLEKTRVQLIPFHCWKMRKNVKDEHTGSFNCIKETNVEENG